MRPSRERFQPLKRTSNPISRTFDLVRLVLTRWLDKACTKSIIFEASEKVSRGVLYIDWSLFLIKSQVLGLELS